MPALTPRRALTLALATTAVFLGASACGGDVADDTPAATVRMGEFFYRPAELTVPAKSKIEIVNDGAVVHTWILKEAGMGTASVRPGQTVIVDLADVRPGSYTIYCDQPGHTQGGQAGKLTVTPA